MAAKKANEAADRRREVARLRAAFLLLSLEGSVEAIGGVDDAAERAALERIERLFLALHGHRDEVKALRAYGIVQVLKRVRRAISEGQRAHGRFALTPDVEATIGHEVRETAKWLADDALRSVDDSTIAAAVMASTLNVLKSSRADHPVTRLLAAAGCPTSPAMIDKYLRR